MNRRNFLSTTPLAAFAGDAAPGAAAQQAGDNGEFHYVDRRQGAHPFQTVHGARRPHIFLICLDMVSPDHFLPSRPLQREMEMPTIRALTAEGVNFTNAFCTVPICSPSRASMYTGRYPYVLANPGGGPEGQENSLRANDVIYPEYLKASGYRTRHVGKNHVGAQKFMDAFDELDTNWARAMPVLKDDGLYHAYLRRLGVKMPRYSRQIQRMYPDRKTPSGTLGGWIEQSDGQPFPIEGQYSWYLSQWAIEKTRDAFASGGPGSPLYLQLNIYDPHNPFTIPAGLEKREAELRKAISLPASFRRAVERNFQPSPGEPALLDFHRRVWGIYRPETARDYMAANALAMEVIDRALARFIKALKEMNIYDESLIIFTADHGEMNIHQALVDKRGLPASRDAEGSAGHQTAGEFRLPSGHGGRAGITSRPGGYCLRRRGGYSAGENGRPFAASLCERAGRSRRPRSPFPNGMARDGQSGIRHRALGARRKAPLFRP